MTEPAPVNTDRAEMSAPAPSSVPAVIRAMRPKQWLKNVLVLSAPLAAGRLLEPSVLVASLLAMVAFSLVSSGVYFINDVRDVDQDRLHPVKRFRPIAAGEVSIRTALLVAVLLEVAGLALGFATSFWLGIVLLTYLLLQISYTLWLKNQPVVDLAVVAIGFLLRALAGAVASDIPISQWFLAVASFGSLFMVAGKRYSELVDLGPDSGTRSSLSRYSPAYLRFVWTAAATLVIAFYALWAFEQGRSVWDVPWAPVSMIPFALGILTYARAIDRGQAGEPETLVLKDRMLIAFGAMWVFTVVLTVWFG